MKLKKLLCTVLAAMMLLSMCGVSSLAADEDDTQTDTSVEMFDPASDETDLTDEDDENATVSYADAPMLLALNDATETDITWDMAEDPTGEDTAAALQAALVTYQTVNLYIGEGNTLDYTVPQGDSGYNYKMTINPGVTLNVKSGTLNFAGRNTNLNRVNICGTLNIESGAVVTYAIDFNIFTDSNVTTPATVNVQSGGKLEDISTASYAPTTSLNPSSIFKPGYLTVEQGGIAALRQLRDSTSRANTETHLTVAGTLTLRASATFKNPVVVSGTIIASDDITNSIGLTIADGGKVEIDGALKNSGALKVEQGGALTITLDYGYIANTSTRYSVENAGTITAPYWQNAANTTVENYGTINLTDVNYQNYSLIQNGGQFTNAGTLSLAGNLYIATAGVVDSTADAQLTVDGTITNNGTITFPVGFSANEGSVNKGTIYVLGENPTYPFGDFDGEATVSNASGRTGYSLTVASALSGAADGDVIVLQKDCTATSSANVNGAATLDLNGKALTMKVCFKIVDGGSLTVTDSSADEAGTVRGYFANVEEFSSLTIEKGTFTGLEDGTLPDYNFTTEGYYTGSGPSPASTLTIKGGDFTAAKGLVSSQYYVNIDIADTVIFRNQDTENFEHLPISVGQHETYEVNITLGEGKELVRTYNAQTGFYEFTQADLQDVAETGGVKYKTLQEAFDNASDGGIVTVLRDHISPTFATSAAGKSVVLDMNGCHRKTLYGNLLVGENGTLTIKDSAESVGSSRGSIRVGNGATLLLDKGANVRDAYAAENAKNVTITVKEGAAAVYLSIPILCSGTINVEGGTVTNSGDSAIYASNSNATVNITGGTITGKKRAIYASYATVNITGGTLNGGIYADHANVTIGGDATITAKRTGGYEQYYLFEDLDSSTITITGGTFTAEKDCDMFYYFLSSLDSGSNITINGGTFTTDDAPMLVASCHTVVINDGEFTTTNAEMFRLDTEYTNKSASLTIHDGTFTTLYQNTAADGETPSAARDSMFSAYERNNSTVDLTVTGGEFTVSDGQTIFTTKESNVSTNGEKQQSITADITGGTFHNILWDSAETEKPLPNYTITGGTFPADVSDDVADNFYVTESDGTYTVSASASQVINTANGTGYTVEMTGLYKNLLDNAHLIPTETATYKVKLSDAPAADIAVIDAAIDADTDAAEFDTRETFDLSVVKITDGKEEKVDGVTMQPVTITLHRTVVGADVQVYHVNGDGVVEKIENVTVSGSDISFTAPSFSTYDVQYNAADVTDAAEAVEVVFEPVTDNEYDIVLRSTDGNVINRLMSLDLTFANSNTDIAYAITPAAKVNLIDAGDGRYEFNFKGVSAASATGTSINIGSVTLIGIGAGTFSVDTTATTNIANTAETSDNILHEYVPGGSTGKGELILDSASFDYELTLATKNLTVNVTFPNNISDNAAAYQDMKATISGGDLAEDIVVDFGSDEAVTLSENAYRFTQPLTLNTTYTVTISGAGYRTARYSVNMTEDKSLTFWNNVMDEAQVIEAGKTTGAVTTNFLAGDIVADNNINIYDLSAVVSYFGTINDTAFASDYAKYDLNRDGVIDSKDVALVLVSWGN